MGDDFEAALRFTFLREGGFSDDLEDHGGPTNKGITQALYSAYRVNRGLPVQSVALAAGAELRDCAYTMVWLPARCAFFHSPVTVVHFDSSYLMGPRHAALLLQAVLGVKTDGEIGQETIAWANRRVAKILAHDLVTARRGYHIKDAIGEPTQGKFVAGWLARCAALDEFVANSGLAG